MNSKHKTNKEDEDEEKKKKKEKEMEKTFERRAAHPRSLKSGFQNLKEKVRD